MADTKISGLADGAPAQATDIVPVARGATTRRLSLTNLATLFGSTFAALVHTHAEADVTNLVSDLAAKASTTHATTHQAGGSDPIALDTLAAPTDVTTLNVTSTKHGLTPKSGADATTFLNGAATPAYAAVKDSDLATTDITTNNVTSTKHGFAPKSGADATTFLNGAATPAYAAVKDSDLSTSDITTNNVATTKHGFAPKLPNDATKYLDGTGAYTVPVGSASVVSVLTLASDATINSTTTGVAITGLNKATGTGTFVFQYYIRHQSAATTTGVKFGINHTGTVTAFAATMRFAGQSGAPTAHDQQLTTPVAMSHASTRAFTTTAPDLGPTISVDVQDADMLTVIDGFLIVTVTGNLELWHASEVAFASTVKAGASLVLIKTS